jgi:hypothetical protein
VSKQRQNHTNNTIRQDRKERLDDIAFVWWVGTGNLVSRSSTPDEVRGLDIASFHALGQVLFLTLVTSFYA